MRLLLVLLLAAAAAVVSAQPEIVVRDGDVHIASEGNVCFQENNGGSSSLRCLDELSLRSEVEAVAFAAANQLAAATADATLSVTSIETRLDTLNANSLNIGISVATASDLLTAVSTMQTSVSNVAGAASLATQSLQGLVASQSTAVETSHEALRTSIAETSDAIVAAKLSHEDLVQIVATLNGAVQDNANDIADVSSSLESVTHDLKTYADTLHDLAVDRAIEQFSAIVTDVTEAQDAADQEQTEQFLALFEEIDTKHNEAGKFFYSFSGTGAINAPMTFQFSVDYGAPGDSMGLGNWYIEIEASQTHCGGGCYTSFFHRKMYWNAYCASFDLYTPAVLTGAGAWTYTREADGYNGHDLTCGTFTVTHSAGAHSFGGPYFLRIRSSKPLVVNYRPPGTTKCTIDCSKGIRCGGGSCQPWACRVSNCPNHRISPSACTSYSRDYFSDGAQTYDGVCRVP